MAVTVRQFNMNSLCNAVVYTGIALLLTVTPSRMGWLKKRQLQTQPAETQCLVLQGNMVPPS